MNMVILNDTKIDLVLYLCHLKYILVQNPINYENIYKLYKLLKIM